MVWKAAPEDWDRAIAARVLPHALAAARLGAEVATAEGADLLHWLGAHFMNVDDYVQAETFLTAALRFRRDAGS